jgi:hypothetical protein
VNIFIFCLFVVFWQLHILFTFWCTKRLSFLYVKSFRCKSGLLWLNCNHVIYVCSEKNWNSFVSVSDVKVFRTSKLQSRVTSKIHNTNSVASDVYFNRAQRLLMHITKKYVRSHRLWHCCLKWHTCAFLLLTLRLHNILVWYIPH